MQQKIDRIFFEAIEDVMRPYLRNKTDTELFDIFIESASSLMPTQFRCLLNFTDGHKSKRDTPLFRYLLVEGIMEECTLKMYGPKPVFVEFLETLSNQILWKMTRLSNLGTIIDGDAIVTFMRTQMPTLTSQINGLVKMASQEYELSSRLNEVHRVDFLLSESLNDVNPPPYSSIDTENGDSSFIETAKDPDKQCKKGRKHQGKSDKPIDVITNNKKLKMLLGHFKLTSPVFF